jgi:hypothetical protein
MRGLPFSHRRPDAAASVGFFSMLFDRQRREQQLLWSVSPLLLLALSLASAPAPGLAEVRLRSEGALLAARGSAEQGSRDGTFDFLHSRLAAVRTALQGLGVREFRAISSSTWQRPAEACRPRLSPAFLHVSATLAPPVPGGGP